MLMQMTEEQRKLAQEKRKEKRANGLSMFKQDWKDDGLWQQLAKEANIRLPQSHIPPSGIKLDKLAKQLGFEEGWQEEFFGVGWKTTTAAIKRENNAQEHGKKYSMRCYVGHILEMWKEKQKCGSKLRGGGEPHAMKPIVRHLCTKMILSTSAQSHFIGAESVR